MKGLLAEFRALLKDKMLILAIFIIPFGVNILLGLEFCEDQVKQIPMAVLNQDNSSLSRNIVQQFRDDDTFNVEYDVSSGEEMQELIAQSRIRAGIIIPAGFSQDIAKMKMPSVLMIYDGSHMSMASTAKAKASEILQTFKVGIAMKVLSGKLSVPADVAQQLAMPVQFSQRTLYNPAKSFKNFLNPGLSVAVVQTGIVMLAAVAVRREELEGGDAARIAYLLKRVVFFTLCGTVSLMMSILIQSKIFGIPFRGSYGTAFLLSLLFSAAVSIFALNVSVIIKDRMIATMINAVLFIPNTIMAGYTWPVISMPAPYRVFARFLPFYHYAGSVRDLFLKGVTINGLEKDILWLCRFIIIALAAAIISISRPGLLRSPIKRPWKGGVTENEFFESNTEGSCINS